MQKIENLLNKYWVPVILFLSIPAGWALFAPGFYGASDDMHIAWLYELHKTLMMGQIPPRFVPDLSYGFGYPLFNFVFPLPFYLGEIFHLLGLSFVDSIKAVFFLSIPLSGIFMYLLLRQFTSTGISLLGALLYIYTPYRSVDLYIRGAIGEIISFVFLPLVVLSCWKIYERKGLRWAGIGGLSIAFLILSHNITAYMFFPFLGLLMILQWFFSQYKNEYIKRVILMVFLGLLTSIYFWLPALVESRFVKYDTVFNFADHFPTLRQLITPYWGYGASVPGPGDGLSFFLGSANIIILFLTIFFIRFIWKSITIQKKILLGWALGGSLLAIILMNHRSFFVWNNFPLLPYFQFPWRFLMLTTLFIPLLLISIGELKYKKILTVVLFVTILPVVMYFRPQDFLGRYDSYYINRYIPNPVASEEYKKTQEEYLRLPVNTLQRPDKNYPRIEALNTTISEVKYINDLDATFKVRSEKNTQINYYKYLFPGWVVKIDNKAIDATAGLPFGQISFVVPQGSHIVNIHFEKTTFKMILDAISLISFLVSLVIAKNIWNRSKSAGLSL